MSLLLAFLLKHWRWFALAVFLAAVAGASYYRGRQDGQAEGRRAVTASEVAKAKEQAKAAEDLAKATQAQAERYRTKAEAQEAIADQYLQELNNAQHKGDKLASDLLAGNVRFRKLWASCQVPASGQTPAHPGSPDGEADDRAESAGRILGAAAACDSHVKALQDLAECDRGMKEKCKS